MGAGGVLNYRKLLEMGLFDSDKKMIDDLAEVAVEALANEAIKIIAKNAPIWSGEYVSSITVETGSSPKSYARSDSPVIEEPLEPGMGQAARAAAVAKGKVESKVASKTKLIHIGNSAPHAHKVEQKHGIYFGATDVIRSKADAIVKRAEAKVKK